MARLQIEFRGSKTIVSLKHGETTVGRSNRCTINLPDPGLAEVHFRIQERTKGYRVKDDGSGSGTRVNGKTVFATTLHDGDLIEAGGVRCIFLEEASSPPVLQAPPARSRPSHPTRAPERDPEGRYRRDAEARRSSQHLKLLVGGAVVLLAVVAGYYFWSQRAAEEEARALYRHALDLVAQSREDATGAEANLREAVTLLEEVRTDYSGTRIRGTALVALDEARRVLNALDSVREEARLIENIEDENGAQEAFSRLARLRDVNHPAIETLVLESEANLKQARLERLETVFLEVRKRADEFATQRKFADALHTWREFEIADYHYSRRAKEAAAQLAQRVAEEYRATLKLASRNDDIDGRIGLLEASRPTFRGTRHSEDLEVRIAGLRARKLRAEVVVLRGPKQPKKPTTDTETPETTPVETGPYEDPPRIVELVKARKYGEAASMLHTISRHPAAKVRIEELTMLAKLMADLAAAVQANPALFDQVLLPSGGGRGDAIGADARYLRVRVKGEETRYLWGELPSRGFLRLFRQAGFEKPPQLATALFFDEEELPKEALRRYVTFFNSEQAPATFTRILARRRGIEPPAGGFLVFRGGLVTPDEQATVLLAERIERLGRDARTSTASRREAAWAELEQIGEPAIETLIASLKERQRQAVEELKSSRAFSVQRYVARFGAELEQRRKHALAFILDANAYAYPNKTVAAQKEAEKRVDAVREIYERPYPLLLDSSDEAKALDAEIRALDQRLAKHDPLGEPLYEAAVAEVTAKLEIANIPVDERDRKRIAYNRSVMEYNRNLKDSSADEEERGNTRAVNEYRWMMGLHAVKIDERLLRGARKHSIEMQQKGYFAHDSPTPSLRNPGMRAKREGYGGGVSENIARGASTGVGAFWQWFGSSGHHRNMLMPNHTEMGCGAARHHWWTQLFGRLTGKSLNPPQVPPDPDPPGESGNGMPAPGGNQ